MIENIGVSYGTLTLLGLNRARALVKPTTAHLLLGENCLHSCSFCAQAKGSTSSSDMLSRVTWPRKSWDDIASPLVQAISRDKVKRVCLQVVESPKAPEKTLAVLSRIRAISKSFPISVCVVPSSISRIDKLFKAGASRVGLPVDAASRMLYEKIKGGNFDRTWGVLERASEMWPGRISTHFIVGMGETEEEIVKCISRSEGLGITTALFAFTPIKGTPMENVTAPTLASYRRIQLAAYHLSKGGSPDSIKFRAGRIVEIAVTDEKTLDDIRKGICFQTSGCSFCNRPYYNERPGQIPMNYPRELTAEEAQECISLSGLILCSSGPVNTGKETSPCA